MKYEFALSVEMKPPICALCGKDFRGEYFHAGTGGELVVFGASQPGEGATPGSGEGASLGHPADAEWFCSKHANAARRVRDLSADQALRRLRAEHGIEEEPDSHEYGEIPDPVLWVTSVGPDRARVFAVLRQATGLAPEEMKALMATVPFQVVSGWPPELETLKSRLEDAGAATEIRYGA